MKYVLLIYNEERNWLNLTPEEGSALRGEYMALSRSLQESGYYRAGEGLEATSTATTVRVRGGQLQTTDGPFAETREQLGGFYLIDAPNLDEAIAIAARIPGARTGSVEIRPALVMPTQAPAAAPTGAAAAVA